LRRCKPEAAQPHTAINLILVSSSIATATGFIPLRGRTGISAAPLWISSERRLQVRLVGKNVLEQVRQLAATIVAKTGRIDGLIHPVGGFSGGQTIAETDDATLDRMLDLNLRSAFHMIRAVLPLTRTQGAGCIVAGSRATVEPAPFAVVYAASIAALLSLIRRVASENADHNVSANVVLDDTVEASANRAPGQLAAYTKWIDPNEVIPVYGGEA
jgi:NAD(P)-dependent dehydrogenase (short-subunit alcohol dehydrogenase family)